MSTLTLAPQMHGESLGTAIPQQITTMIDGLIANLPNPKSLTIEQRRGILARYTAVLEGNFIYWMTATYIAVKSDEVRHILTENLLEEVRDSHPVMMRKFAVAAHAFPNANEALSIDRELTEVRLFLGKLQGVESVLTMAFFEGWIQRFMGFLASLAAEQGSSEREYTDVHGVCDIAHSAELFRALALEMAVNPIGSNVNLFEGVNLLRTLIIAVVEGPDSTLRNSR
jgi:Iron-containing redox enzyme